MPLRRGGKPTPRDCPIRDGQRGRGHGPGLPGTCLALQQEGRGERSPHGRGSAHRGGPRGAHPARSPLKVQGRSAQLGQTPARGTHVPLPPATGTHSLRVPRAALSIPPATAPPRRGGPMAQSPGGGTAGARAGGAGVRMEAHTPPWQLCRGRRSSPSPPGHAGCSPPHPGSVIPEHPFSRMQPGTAVPRCWG